MQSVSKLTNLDYLENFTKGDKERMKKYIEMYLKSTPDVIRDFQKEFNDLNLENLRLKAHSIKPQAKYFGIKILEDILIEIETIIKSNKDVDKLQPLISNAIQINEKIASELTTILNA